jgi:ketosteroid isomerase-like protein
VDTEAAVRRWIDGWTRGWSAHDPDPIAALYAPDAVFVSRPFRDPQTPADYAAQVFAEEESAEFRFGEPVVGDGSAAIEYWATNRSDGREQTLAGVSVIRFDRDGLVTHQRDYWVMEEGRRGPSPGWR